MIKLEIDSISYPSEISEKKFDEYYNSLPAEIKDRMPNIKDDLKAAWMNGFEGAVEYLGNLGNEKDIKVVAKIDYYEDGGDDSEIH